jgi:hypothetical protein
MAGPQATCGVRPILSPRLAGRPSDLEHEDLFLESSRSDGLI